MVKKITDWPSKLKDPLCRGHSPLLCILHLSNSSSQPRGLLRGWERPSLTSTLPHLTLTHSELHLVKKDAIRCSCALVLPCEIAEWNFASDKTWPKMVRMMAFSDILFRFDLAMIPLLLMMCPLRSSASWTAILLVASTNCSNERCFPGFSSRFFNRL